MHILKEVMYLYIVKNCGNKLSVLNMSKFIRQEEVLLCSLCFRID